jgi:hypothetical protein
VAAEGRVFGRIIYCIADTGTAKYGTGATGNGTDQRKNKKQRAPGTVICIRLQPAEK